MLIACECGRRFPFNPDKHRYDKLVYCPSCKTAIKNPTKLHFKLPSFNLNWIKHKLAHTRKKKEAKKFLDRYFKTTRINERGIPEECYAFPLKAWMKGRRPIVSEEMVKRVLGPNATEELMLSELKYLEKLGVNVR